ncbi:hypothetical protein HNO93_001126 [Agrobacterium vitis]|nr:hypothetical protein [Agrobacterium vitis]
MTLSDLKDKAQNSRLDGGIFNFSWPFRLWM